MDLNRVDALIAYAISLTGKRGETRSLGRVQLMKLVYLADLEVAQRSGETYTGTTWRFLHFGPFSGDVAHRIEPAADAIHARSSTFRHDDTDTDHTRWSGEDVDLPKERLRSISVVAKMAIDRALKQFDGNTTELLHHVYSTTPMLHAAPGDVLDLTVRGPTKTTAPTLPEAEAKHRREAGARLREQLASRPSERGRDLVRVEPEYDDRFRALVDALAQEAGEPGEFEGVVEFPPDIWKSGWRGGEGDGGEVP